MTTSSGDDRESPARRSVLSRRGAIVLASALALLAVALVGARLVQVHRAEGTWSLTMPRLAHRIHVFERDYDRGQLPSAPDPGLVEGATVPGGTVLVEPDLGRRTPLVIQVRDEEGTFWTYGLVGGP